MLNILISATGIKSLYCKYHPATRYKYINLNEHMFTSVNIYLVRAGFPVKIYRHQSGKFSEFVNVAASYCSRAEPISEFIKG